MITITESLAEIKTIGKRLESKREFVMTYLLRQDAMKDPLSKDGGSVQALDREMQAMRDLEERVVRIRIGINESNLRTKVRIGRVERSVAEWLVWRREVAPLLKARLHSIAQRIEQGRAEAQRKGVAVISPGTEASKGSDLIVNYDEALLAKQREELEETLATLDGRLSLLNATTTIEV